MSINYSRLKSGRGDSNYFVANFYMEIGSKIAKNVLRNLWMATVFLSLVDYNFRKDFES